MHTTPPSASTIAPASNKNSPVPGSRTIEAAKTFELQTPTASAPYARNARTCETRRRRTLPTGVNAYRRDTLCELQQLALGSGGVAQEQHVDVAAEIHAVRQLLARAAEEQACHRFLLVIEAKDAGGDGAGDAVIYVGRERQLAELLWFQCRFEISIIGGLPVPLLRG